MRRVMVLAGVFSAFIMAILVGSVFTGGQIHAKAPDGLFRVDTD